MAGHEVFILPIALTRQPRSTAFAPRAQLSILEHALCPLDSRISLKPAFAYRTSFNYTDPNRNRKQATVDVGAVHGISATDELCLWGLLGLALSQSEPGSDFQATPFWCLNQLGMINDAKSGGEEFRLFRESLKRIAGVRYYCDRFFDPILREHREVSFGFLNFSLPHSTVAGRTARHRSRRTYRVPIDVAADSMVKSNKTTHQTSPARLTYGNMHNERFRLWMRGK